MGRGCLIPGDPREKQAGIKKLLPQLFESHLTGRNNRFQQIQLILFKSQQHAFGTKTKHKRISLFLQFFFCLFLLDGSSIVPWLLSFKRGTALEERGNKILVRETGYFFIYGQVKNSVSSWSLFCFLQSFLV